MNKLEELEVSQEEAVNTTTAEEHREHPDRAKMSEFDLFNLSDKDRQGAARVQAEMEEYNLRIQRRVKEGGRSVDHIFSKDRDPVYEKKLMEYNAIRLGEQSISSDSPKMKPGSSGDPKVSALLAEILAVQQKEEREYEKIRKRAQEQEQHLAASREQAQAYHEENMKANEKTHRMIAINSQQLATLNAQVGELIAMLHTSKENISIG